MRTQILVSSAYFSVFQTGQYADEASHTSKNFPSLHMPSAAHTGFLKMPITPSHKNKSIGFGSFRHDINGLRAWAVLSVVLFHFGVPGFAGGFVGVDVFFVISGFLMTGIIVSALRDQSFSFLKFYLARARRIMPALLVLCMVLLVLGWFLLITSDYQALSRQIQASILFRSNHRYWNEAGYFDTASHEKWLLHTWSLSVEWQFYLLLPIALWMAWRLWGERGLKWTLLTTAAASLLFSILATQRWPSMAFYLLPARAWEMLAGGLVWWRTNARPFPLKNRWMEATGFLLIATSITLLDNSSPWPGSLALLPVAGSVLVLANARQDSQLTANWLAQYLGARSYSIYLWHWPLVVALTYTELQQEWQWLAGGLVMTLLLGELSYRLIETQARKRLSRLSIRIDLSVLATATVVVGLMAVGARNNSATSRLPAVVEVVAQEAFNKKPNQDKCFATSGSEAKSCIYGGQNVSAILLGDSHADAITTAVQYALPNKKQGVLDWTYVSCPTLVGAKLKQGIAPDDQRCHEFNNWALGKLKDSYAGLPLVMVSRTSVYAFGHNEPWEKTANTPLISFSKEYATPTPAFLSEFKRSLINTACSLSKKRPIYLVRPIPEMGIDVPKIMSRRLMFTDKAADISISLTDYHKRHAFTWAAQDEAARRCGVKILDPLPYLCSEGRCWGSKNGRPLYYDDDHLSEYGNKLLVPMFRSIFTESESPPLS